VVNDSLLLLLLLLQPPTRLAFSCTSRAARPSRGNSTALVKESKRAGSG